VEIQSKITEPQRDFLTSLADVTVFEGGIGAGKTRVLCTKGIQSALKGRTFLLVSFSYPTLRDVCLQTLVILLEQEFKLPYKLNRAEMTVQIGPGRILLRSGDQPDKLRGINAHDWGIDEAREFKDRSVYDILLGRARNCEDAQGFISTTTKGKNWVFELRDQNSIKFIRQSTFDNPFLPESYKKRLLDQYTSEFARQELYADIVEMGAGIIRPDWFNEIQYYHPKSGVRFWDLAVSIKTYADYSAGALCSFDPNDKFVIHDINKQKMEFPDLKKEIIRTAQGDGTNVVICIEEAGQQLGFIQELERIPELKPYSIKKLKPKGDKLNRAMPWASRAEMGRVDVCRGKWTGDFLDECAGFTADDTHMHDDQIDAVSGAYSMLSNKTTYQVWKGNI
jgi:predicted phage terminase large subunit-like protein